MRYSSYWYLSNASARSFFVGDGEEKHYRNDLCLIWFSSRMSHIDLPWIVIITYCIKKNVFINHAVYFMQVSGWMYNAVIHCITDGMKSQTSTRVDVGLTSSRCGMHRIDMGQTPARGVSSFGMVKKNIIGMIYRQLRILKSNLLGGRKTLRLIRNST